MESYGWSRDEFLALTVLNLRPPEDVARFIESNARLRQRPGGVDTGVWRHRRRDGETIYVQVTAMPVLFGGRTARGVVARDISDRRMTEAALVESEQRYRALVEIMPEAVTVVDLEGRILAVNQQAARMHGFDRPEEMVGQAGFEFMVPEDRVRSRSRMSTLLADGTLPGTEYELLRRDGSRFHVEVSSSLVRDAEGRPKAILGVARDLSERRRAEEQLRHYAIHDSLTTLPTAEVFREHVARSVERSARQDGYRFAVILLDLDRFRPANESLGHTAGDQLLIGISGRLKECLRPGDVLARYGGDEFAVLINGLETPDEAEVAADRIHAALKPPFTVAGQQVHISASLGIAVGAAGPAKAEDILRDAAAALGRAKAGGKARSVVFVEGMSAGAPHLVRLENELRRAVERLEFTVHYQPVVALAQGRTVALEALVRWQHPDRQLVLPAEFIPMAEETGLIEPIGEWVLRESCKQYAAFHAADRNGLRISVNVSARQFSHTNLPAMVRAALAETGMPATALALEITETVAMDNLAYSVTVLHELAEMGVMIAIDDFGIAYSSLNYLKKFPIKAIKIDQSFVRDLVGSADDQAITRAIIAMAHRLDLLVIAEGVETVEQLRLIRRFRCDHAQGYLLSPPVPAAEALRLLSSARPYRALAAPRSRPPRGEEAASA